MQIDWNFISEREGGRHLVGYLPKKDGEVLDSSGVTIATGFDIGQHSVMELERMELPRDLIDILEPYCLASGEDAEYVVDIHGLPEISESEAFIVDAASHKTIVDEFKRKFDKVSVCPFWALHPQIQTAITSVAFQYGTNLKRRTPMFWSQVTRCDWENAIYNLKNFGDKYSTRRGLEAKLIESCMS